jgi:4-hydroxybenzoate polyprenyltransferase
MGWMPSRKSVTLPVLATKMTRFVSLPRCFTTNQGAGHRILSAFPKGSCLADFPLVVDLDGTLVRTDMLHESALQTLRDRPWDLLRIPFWLGQGKAVLKKQLASRSHFDPATLPYAADFLDWLRQQYATGRRLILCTASDRKIAEAIACHLGLFVEVLASDGTTNLAGGTKAALLERRFGNGGFDYAGNSRADLVVWHKARHAIVVNASPRVLARVATPERCFPPPSRGLQAWRRLLRIHQWLKNLLLFVPLLAAHRVFDTAAWLMLLQAFAAFCLCASSVYVANDLLDLESDRAHPRKRFRPFAAGVVPIHLGIPLAPALLGGGVAIAWSVGGHFMACLLVYFVLTCAYSWGLKRLVVVDCLALAVLYTLRIVAGAAAVSMPLSFWLLAFSVFLFLSLAFVKRYAELEIQLLSGREKVHGRGYFTSDAPLLQSLGVTAGYASALVLALYLNSAAVVILYRTPEIVWGAVPVVLFWISWMWMKAHRGEMHDDPVVFAVRDPVSLLSGLICAGVLLLGAVGVPW